MYLRIATPPVFGLGTMPLRILLGHQAAVAATKKRSPVQETRASVPKTLKQHVLHIHLAGMCLQTNFLFFNLFFFILFLNN